MFVLGVTGPSGAGKGTACEILEEYGFYHIDTDRLAGSVYPRALPLLKEAFGPTVEQDGEVNRSALAKAAFANAKSTEMLNSIMHPLIMEEVSKRIQLAEMEGFSAVTVDGAALHEAHAETVCDRMLCILAPRELRAERIIRRDFLSEEAANLRLNAQKEDSYYANNTDAVLVNRTVEQLRNELLSLIKEWHHE